MTEAPGEGPEHEGSQERGGEPHREGCGRSRREQALEAECQGGANEDSRPRPRRDERGGHQPTPTFLTFCSRFATAYPQKVLVAPPVSRRQPQTVTPIAQKSEDL